MRKDEEVNRAVAAYENAVASVEDSKMVTELPATASPSVNHDSPLNKARGRRIRPNIGRRQTITEYSEHELITLISWIESDGRLRTNEEIIDELLPELGFQRRGARIDGVLQSILERHRNSSRTAG
jgi:hypothetical protein